MHLSGYRIMWVLAMFDLPVDTRKARREYVHFRKMLLKDGFVQLQFSIYARPCASVDNAAVHISRVERSLPPDGNVRILSITDKQFGRMRNFWGKMRKRPERTPRQLEIF